MEPIKLYPKNPTEVPADLTEPRTEFRRHAWLAMAGLTGFILAYLALLGCFGWISYTGVQHLINSRFDLVQFLVTTSSLILTLFMAKSLFAVRRFGAPDGIEVTAAAQPELALKQLISGCQSLYQPAQKIPLKGAYDVLC